MGRKIQHLKTAELSLSEATQPLLIISRLFGLIPKTWGQKIYTIFLIICVLLLLRMLIYFGNKLNLGNNELNIVVYVLEVFCRTLSILVIYISTFFNAKRYVVPIKDITDIDKSWKHAGGYISNRATYRLAISQVIFVSLVPFLLAVLEFGTHAVWTNSQSYRITFLLSFLYNWKFTTICVLVDCTFVMNLSIIKKRFEQINAIIRRAGNRGLYLRIKFLQLASENTEYDVLQILKITRRECHKLWLIANQVNHDYSPHLLTELVTSLCLLTIELWSTYFTINYRLQNNFFVIITGSIIWGVYHLVKILLLAGVCESTIAEGRATAILLQELDMNEDQSPAIKREVQDFLILLQLKIQHFNACKFFDINFKLICGILSAVCTYLVILIQMNQPNTCATTEVANDTEFVRANHHS